MTTYSVTSLVHNGLTITLVAPSALTGDLVPIAAQGSPINTLVVVNGGTSTTVTLTPPTFDGMTVGPRSVSIPANSLVEIPIPASVYGPAGQTVAVSYANITTLAGGATGVAVVAVPPG